VLNGGMRWVRLPKASEWVLVSVEGFEVARIGRVRSRYHLVTLDGLTRVFDDLAKAKRRGVARWTRVLDYYAAGLHVMRL